LGRFTFREEGDMFRKVMISIFICLFAMSWGYAAQKATPEEAKKMVEQAVAYVKSKRPRKSSEGIPISLRANS